MRSGSRLVTDTESNMSCCVDSSSRAPVGVSERSLGMAKASTSALRSLGSLWRPEEGKQLDFHVRSLVVECEDMYSPRDYETLSESSQTSSDAVTPTSVMLQSVSIADSFPRRYSRSKPPRTRLGSPHVGSGGRGSVKEQGIVSPASSTGTEQADFVDDISDLMSDEDASSSASGQTSNMSLHAARRRMSLDFEKSQPQAVGFRCSSSPGRVVNATSPLASPSRLSRCSKKDSRMNPGAQRQAELLEEWYQRQRDQSLCSMPLARPVNAGSASSSPSGSSTQDMQDRISPSALPKASGSGRNCSPSGMGVAKGKQQQRCRASMLSSASSSEEEDVSCFSKQPTLLSRSQSLDPSSWSKALSRGSTLKGSKGLSKADNVPSMQSNTESCKPSIGLSRSSSSIPFVLTPKQGKPKMAKAPAASAREKIPVAAPASMDSLSALACSSQAKAGEGQKGAGSCMQPTAAAVAWKKLNGSSRLGRTISMDLTLQTKGMDANPAMWSGGVRSSSCLDGSWGSEIVAELRSSSSPALRKRSAAPAAASAAAAAEEEESDPVVQRSADASVIRKEYGAGPSISTRLSRTWSTPVDSLVIEVESRAEKCTSSSCTSQSKAKLAGDSRENEDFYEQRLTHYGYESQKAADGGVDSPISERARAAVGSKRKVKKKTALDAVKVSSIQRSSSAGGQVKSILAKIQNEPLGRTRSLGGGRKVTFNDSVEVCVFN